MPIAQITLTVEESKKLIAMAVSIHPKVKNVLEKGNILFKGGSTVSQVSKTITGNYLRLCGMITKRGCVVNVGDEESLPHVALYKNGEFINIDETFLQDVLKLTENDLIICGANAIDPYGNAAMMTGSLGGGDTPFAFGTWYGEGVPVIIPVGLEKLIPNNINEIIKLTGRRKKKYSTGMSVGLMPVIGEIITEVNAIKLLTGLEAIPIAAGGIGNGKGSVTLDVIGEEKELKKLMDLILDIKDQVLYEEENYLECKPICLHCKEHLGCIYKSLLRG
ncbi:hypothetical protein [Tepidimicrobium xylanilyticum]|uniref:Uncharacterized protein n=1 Tax=Tepidimicrobium xylanilyticum TaxID=1123352 RepID=A0A1H2Q2N2_9FIRM|nr:hypothetical protein [Tepidimicrobium xylanilyticum]GMG95771.1 hypothetical protein EN5CB1_05970 [Tepidimicrobium xylanilyticum]SDW01372.1 hypothetical protein SAMN05660923_00035 [Tepidimicrobium xylanilyticum]